MKLCYVLPACVVICLFPGSDSCANPPDNNYTSFSQVNVFGNNNQPSKKFSGSVTPSSITFAKDMNLSTAKGAALKVNYALTKKTSIYMSASYYKSSSYEPSPFASESETNSSSQDYQQNLPGNNTVQDGSLGTGSETYSQDQISALSSNDYSTQPDSNLPDGNYMGVTETTGNNTNAEAEAFTNTQTPAPSPPPTPSSPSTASTDFPAAGDTTLPPIIDSNPTSDAYNDTVLDQPVFTEDPPLQTFVMDYTNDPNQISDPAPLPPPPPAPLPLPLAPPMPPEQTEPLTGPPPPTPPPPSPQLDHKSVNPVNTRKSAKSENSDVPAVETVLVPYDIYNIMLGIRHDLHKSEYVNIYANIGAGAIRFAPDAPDMEIENCFAAEAGLGMSIMNNFVLLEASEMLYYTDLRTDENEWQGSYRASLMVDVFSLFR